MAKKKQYAEFIEKESKKHGEQMHRLFIELLEPLRRKWGWSPKECVDINAVMNKVAILASDQSVEFQISLAARLAADLDE